MRTALLERLCARIEFTTGCWLWRGTTVTGGYGEISVGEGAQKHRERVHRVMYELAHGPIAPGLQANHRCDTPACVRPSHIFIGDQSANMYDMVSKGRFGSRKRYYGETHHLATISDDTARAIRRRFLATAVTKKALAREYGVCPSTVGNIVKGIGRFKRLTP